MNDDRILILLNGLNEAASDVDAAKQFLLFFRQASAGKPCFRCKKALRSRSNTHDLDYAPYCSYQCQQWDMLDRVKSAQQERFARENRLAARLDEERQDRAEQRRLDALANERCGESDPREPCDNLDPGIPQWGS